MRFLVPFAFLLAFVVAASQANADTIALNNMPGNGTYSPVGLTTTTWAAVGMTTDASQESFSSLTAEFRTQGSSGTAEGGIFSDNSNKPGTLLAAFNNATVPSGVTSAVTLTTTAPYTMLASTKYWFVLHDSVNFSWESDSANAAPTAATGFTFNGYQTSANSGSSWSNLATFNPLVQISTSAVVPEPSTFALLAAAGSLILVTRATRRRNRG